MVSRKKCVICKKYFTKPKFISNRIFTKRKYCTKNCYNIGMSGKGHWNYGKKTSKIIREKISNSLQGEKHPNWKGGFTTVKQQEKLAGRIRPTICEICGKNSRICFDHDHKTNKFRGWICRNCNIALGMVNDDIEILDNLIKYLKNY